MAATKGTQDDQPRSPYDQYCYESLKMIRIRQPFYTNEMLEMCWPESDRELEWAVMSDAEKERYRNIPREDWIVRPPTVEHGYNPLPPLKFKCSRRDFTAVEIYCEEQFRLLSDEAITSRIKQRAQFHRDFALLPEVQKRRLKRKAHRRNVRKAAFKTLSMERSPTDFESPEADRNWVFIRPLGKGGYGRAYQMARLDRNENVIENMAVKITDLYFNATTWNFQMGGPNNMLREIAYHEHVSNLEQKHVVEFLHYHVDEMHRSYRIYMEYCPYGDLGGLIQEYQVLKTGIPEQFLWYVLEALALVCEAMENNLARTDGQIVHLDLNPCNVFLGFEDAKHFPVYPTPKVADFGLAVETDLDDRRNPEKIAYNGTRGYYAPENNLNMWDKNRHRMKMALGTTKIYGYTNIYQCGMILYSLLRLRFGRIAGLHEGFNAPPAPPAANFQQPDVPFSDELIGVIYSCLLSNPSERATSKQLADVVDEIIEDVAGEMAKHKDEFGDYYGRDRKYPGKLMYDVDQEKLAFIPQGQVA